MWTLALFNVIVLGAIANPLVNTLADDVHAEDKYKGYRLPSTQIPSSYKLNLIVDQEVFNDTKYTFDGTVEITLKVTEKLTSLQLHAPMKINSAKLDDANIPNTDFNETTSIRTFLLDAPLDPAKDHTLYINFTADIDLKTMYGFYRSIYMNEKNETEYLLATQFEPVSARQAFPCFDEPSYKATFTVTITYPKGYNALSNTPQTTAPISVSTTQEQVTFKPTPKISTYLVAFIVSKFTCSKKETQDKVEYSVCSRSESGSTRQLAVDWGKKLLQQLSTYTGINYNSAMSKMDQVAIPDFGAGAMENWGLVTYRERDLLYDDDESSDTYKQNIVAVIAHEFTHQWFGDLVTCDWWDDSFLNEGFAQYFSYFLLTQIKETTEWEMDKQFIVKEQHRAMIDDASLTSQALTAVAASPEEIHAKFNSFSSITYRKGASIIRMMENIMGTANFKKGLIQYLKAKSNSIATPKDLLDALAAQKPSLPSKQTFNAVMENWLNMAGYPVVRVTVQNNTDINIKQKRFLYNGDDNTRWIIPISYTLQTDDKKFDTVTPKVWLTETNQTIKGIQNSTSWIILNNKESAFYRVQYEETLWKRIVAQLEADHNQIDVLNRAQIVDDILNFARAGYEMKYSEAFNYLRYLVNETDYYPWNPAITSFVYLLTKVGENSALGNSVKSKVLELLGGVYKTVSFEGNDTKQIDALKRDLILYSACRFGNKNCSDESLRLFSSFRTNRTKINKNLKRVVYCNTLRYGIDVNTDWTFLWQKYQETDLSTEQVTILEALGCARDSKLLKDYLAYSFDETKGIRIQDFDAVWASVYTNGPDGIQAALDVLVDKHDAIIQYNPDAASLLTGIASQISSQSQIDKMKKFLEGDDVNDAYKKAGAAALEVAQANIKWLEKMKGDLDRYLLPSKGGSSRTATFSCFILAAATLFKFLI